MSVCGAALKKKKKKNTKQGKGLESDGVAIFDRLVREASVSS